MRQKVAFITEPYSFLEGRQGTTQTTTGMKFSLSLSLSHTHTHSLSLFHSLSLSLFEAKVTISTQPLDKRNTVSRCWTTATGSQTVVTVLYLQSLCVGGQWDRDSCPATRSTVNLFPKRWSDRRANTFRVEVQNVERVPIPTIRIHDTDLTQTKNDFLPSKWQPRFFFIWLDQADNQFFSSINSSRAPQRSVPRLPPAEGWKCEYNADRVVNDSAIVSVTGTDVCSQDN
jgi:hypothetical protein